MMLLDILAIFMIIMAVVFHSVCYCSDGPCGGCKTKDDYGSKVICSVIVDNVFGDQGCIDMAIGIIAVLMLSLAMIV
jgi:hypothetical protein